jgi:hypothetical protein
MRKFLRNPLRALHRTGSQAKPTKVPRSAEKLIDLARAKGRAMTDEHVQEGGNASDFYQRRHAGQADSLVTRSVHGSPYPFRFLKTIAY